MALNRIASAIVCCASLYALAACGGEDSAPPAAGPIAGGPTPSPAPAPSTTLPAGQNTAFANRTAQMQVVHDFGFSAGLNPMVAQFAGGAASGDIDNDGDLDVFVARGDTGPNLLYINQGGARFDEGAQAAGLAFTLGAGSNGRHSGPTFGDLDGDGDLDLLLGGLENGPTKVFMNDGLGRFTDATVGSGFEFATTTQTISMALGDYDGDGDLDFVIDVSTAPEIRIYLNDGAGNFSLENTLESTASGFGSVYLEV
ncbi:MAG: FG-GAP-like repeat-containing protein, partial [Pseudomonadota bacterium]